MQWWAIILGTGIVLFTLRQVFQDLFHPSVSGSMSEFIARNTFNLFRHWGRCLKNAGPLSVLLVIFAWALSMCLGFAVIYWGLPADALHFEGEGKRSGFVAMIYFSFEMMTTLGLGDFTPVPDYVRLIAVMQALMGFAVLTASVSSIVLIHPAVGRLRVLARTVSVLTRALEKSAQGRPACQPDMLLHLTMAAARARFDLIHFPIIYYFSADEEHASLPGALCEIQRLAEISMQSSRAEVADSAQALAIAVADLAQVLGSRFLHCGPADTWQVLRAFERHHSGERDAPERKKG